MKRIAYVVSEYPALSHTFIRREIGALRERSLTIHPISIRRGADTGDEHVPAILDSKLGCLLAAGRMLFRAPLRSAATWQLAQSHRPPGLKGWLWAQFHFIEALALSSQLAALKVDHIHSHFANSGATVSMLSAHALRLPWSLTLHGISETDPPAGQLLPAKLKRADFVACASWFMRAQAMRVSSATQWSKFHVVRCGVELTVIRRIAARASHRSHATRFITVGRLSPEKGHRGLVGAFERLVKDGMNATLTIVGDGPSRRELESLVRASSARAAIRLAGSLPEDLTLEEIASSDVFVLSSFMEGLPVVLIEAMALGLPVIAPMIAGIPELVRDRETGLLYPASDWRALETCMATMATDLDARIEMAAAARARVESEFNIQTAVEPLSLLFQDGDRHEAEIDG